MKAEYKAGKPTPWPVLLKLVPFFFLFACFSFYYSSGNTNQFISAEIVYQPELVSVPQYVGMQLDRAVSRMPNDRLAPGQINEVYSDDSPGMVVGQFPEAEMLVDPGTQINLEVSLGPPPRRRVEVPNVTGMNIAEAEAILRESNLGTGQISERLADEREPGTVLEQSPQAGTVVMENTGVDLVVSIRDFRVTVPDLISMKMEKAIRVLKENRLNYELNYENSGRPENTVIKQEPPPGTRVNEGDVVFLIVSRKKQFSLLLFFGGFLAIAIFGGFVGYRLKKTKTGRNRLPEKNLVTYKPVWEAGRQILNVHGNKLADSSLRIKYIQDLGSSTILKP
ncbi:PASTA domain-containing protein [Mariniphaga sp.]|uniref:PASTA domain-containing protein n=1 Tax=Mariniphaga sp. TaxID=1954475 RepID=UPI003567CAED